ncbi:MAG: hypothetical protein ABI591_13705 [Kofleriaceae bacterium]
MRTICGVVLVVLAACDAGAPSCKDGVAKAVKHGADMSADQQAILTQVCDDRKWSGNLRGCLGRASSDQDVSTCLKPVMEDVTLANADAAANVEAKRASEQLQVLQPQLDLVTKDVDAAIDAVIKSTTDEQRSSAQAALAAVRAKRSDLEARLADATTLAHTKWVHISRDCLDNPLAAGCQ